MRSGGKFVGVRSISGQQREGGESRRGAGRRPVLRLKVRDETNLHLSGLRKRGIAAERNS